MDPMNAPAPPRAVVVIGSQPATRPWFWWEGGWRRADKADIEFKHMAFDEFAELARSELARNEATSLRRHHDSCIFHIHKSGAVLHITGGGLEICKTPRTATYVLY